MNTPTINTIITLVVRLKETIIIMIPGEEFHYIEWEKTHNEPQVIEPGIENPGIYGIIDVIEWLKQLPDDTNFWIDPFS
jgi:hypothetical protein